MATDLLSDILADLCADAVVTGYFSLTAPFALSKPAVDGAMFRTAFGSPFYVIVAGMEPVLVEPGDFLLLPHGHEHVLASSPEVRPVPFDDLMASQGIRPSFDTPLRFSAGGGGSVSELYTGIVVYREAMRCPLFSVLPPLIHVRANDPAMVPWLASTLSSFIRESMSCQPGWAVAAARLADVLFVQLLRAHLGSAVSHTGWLRGIMDPQIGKAIALLHRNPERDWTVESLAAAAGMSRSRFSARFVELAGETPIGHLTSYRMYLASDALRHTRQRLIEIAERVGYASEKAFIRAFRRWSGMAPKQYARSEARSLRHGP
ncbi:MULTISPECIES: AraC family transcriptional regulator [unclassified Caballeronia]|uniref:AraC family transcriptional regulator n=1 Tax=unclassified Caballeronia TaxID=2646786 RepID=UPI00285E5764|nr:MULTISPECIES: AraC family transcriptional regulator [unclassified Caballeronia]MDR5815378.1 AraC family transcriptional regulator [Caballeronia sp. LZ033]MDR5821735.1 AraC family transcriptional regulator [Caballeronia sp. LZ043]MDR5880108.1 AraC family transcriptional regulator [Caballeronia sp. LZ032]